jgi:spore coat polysaccharide biosynthesis protein SpsF
MPGNHDYSKSHRWTLDYEEDYRLIREIVENLYYVKPMFSIHDILKLFSEKPELGHINARHQGSNWYRNHIYELNTFQPTKEQKI